ncbi:beta-galactosidase, partial [Rhizobium leguminosarum]
VEDDRNVVMEMIEDIPEIGPVNASVRLPAKPKRVFDAMTGEDLAWEAGADGAISITVPRLHIHSAVVFEGV